MDKKIVKKLWSAKRVTGLTLLILFLLSLVYYLLFSDKRSTLRVEKDKVIIGTVQQGVFQEFIPQTGVVQPSRQVYLDVIEGGTIKAIIKESGAIVKKGDEILQITNLNRELSVLQQEATFNESINRAREVKISIMRNDMEQRQLIASIDNQLMILTPQYERQSQLFKKRLISKQEFERIEADYNFNIERKQIAYELYKNDSVDRIRQLKGTSESEFRMIKSLNGVRKILDNLTIRAPIDGQLSMLHWEVGQAISTGQRIGQVDIIGSYRLRVPIDELYLPRIYKGLNATTEFAGNSYELKITYIYPNIVSGRFEVDMDFDGETPKGIRPGQSMRLRIELGDSSEQLVIPVGGFFKDTGGNWVYVLVNDSKAVKRNIKLGRKNTDNFEVLEGLKVGEQLIISSYENFGDNEVIILK